MQVAEVESAMHKLQKYAKNICFLQQNMYFKQKFGTATFCHQKQTRKLLEIEAQRRACPHTHIANTTSRRKRHLKGVVENGFHIFL